MCADHSDLPNWHPSIGYNLQAIGKSFAHRTHVQWAHSTHFDQVVSRMNAIRNGDMLDESLMVLDLEFNVCTHMVHEMGIGSLKSGKRLMDVLTSAGSRAPRDYAAHILKEFRQKDQARSKAHRQKLLQQSESGRVWNAEQIVSELAKFMTPDTINPHVA